MKVRATARVFGASVVRLVVSEFEDFIPRERSELIAVNDFGFVRGCVEGLEPGKSYYLGVESKNGQIANRVGRFRTPSSAAHSFSFAGASCSRTGSNELVFDAIRARAEAGEVDFFVHMGDMHYENIAVNDEKVFHQAFDTVFSSPRQNALWRNLPMLYMWDDHDYGPNDSDRDSPARQAAIAAYRRRVPSPPLHLSGDEDAPYFSYIRGRVRFVFTDVRSERAEKGEFPSTDPNQVVMADTQRDWFFDELLAAQAADQVVIWVNTKPWVGTVINGEDHWGGYDAARQEIADFIDANDLNRRIAIFSGDMHALAYDDGSSINNPGGLQVMQSAAMHHNGSSKGGPYTIGPVRNPPSGQVTQYAIVDVTDETGVGDVGVRFRGISVDQSTGEETFEFDVNFELGANE